MSDFKREFKECVIVNGVIWSIGPWNYDYNTQQTGTDEDDNPIYEEVAMNPMPEGAIIDHRWFEYTNERGWYESGTEPYLNLNDETRRNFVDLYALLIQKNVIHIDEVPSYKEYDIQIAVRQKISDGDA